MFKCCCFEWSMCLATPLASSKTCHLKLKERNISNKHNRLKDPNWREAHQLTIYKRDWEVWVYQY